MNAVKCNMGGKPGKQCRGCILAKPHWPSVPRKCQRTHRCNCGRTVFCRCVSVVPPVEPLRPRYAGPDSVKFWKQVNSLKGKDKDSAYLLGVILQDVEGRVLQDINEKLEKRK